MKFDVNIKITGPVSMKKAYKVYGKRNCENPPGNKYNNAWL